MLRTLLRSTLGVALALALLGGPALAQAPDSVVRWRLQSFFSSSLPNSGATVRQTMERLGTLSGNRFRVTWHEPGALIPPGQCWDAVSQGSVDVCFGTAAFYLGRNTAFGLFSAVPFGMDMPGYLGWFYAGGGKQIYDELYARGNIVAMPCVVVIPEMAFFREELGGVAGLRGRRLRYLGLAGPVVERLGASTMALPPSEIFAAFERGVIDGGEFASPGMDVAIGLHEVARFYYTPGWHQPATIYDVIINRDAWNKLSDSQRMQFETACGDGVRRSLYEGASGAPVALAEMDKRGVQFRHWSTEDMNALERAWLEVVAEQSAANPDFKRTWESIVAFRSTYDRWANMQYRPLSAR